nr:hypothetical protein CFP56_74628 [Quercus suber]
MVEVLLSRGTKSRIRAPWSKTLIVKVFGRSVGFNYLTFKINAMWNPKGKMECVALVSMDSEKSTHTTVARGITVHPTVGMERGNEMEIWVPTLSSEKDKMAVLVSRQSQGHSNTQRDDCPNQSITHRHDGLVRFGSSSMGPDSQPMVAVPHRHPPNNGEGCRSLEHAKEAINSASLGRIELANSR